ncbi:MAG: serine/threonine-protein phosphatase [Phycisphaerales bacterium]|nr:serine/threonine-protein phosphatase [Phycisphaerales bacterium]MCB9840776.1 serine/threonine-protein phosphatase [Phycisphaeraceae bacterium]
MQCMEILGGSEPSDRFVSVPGIDAEIVSRPHEGQAEGGDIHYVSSCAAGLIARFVLADVAGHGVSVAGEAAKLRRLVRKHMNAADQSGFARSVNREFSELASQGRFATALLMTYFTPTDHLLVVSAGHPRPLWYRAAAREWSILDDAHESVARSAEEVGIADLPLGVIGETGYHQLAVPLAEGDVIVAYTDALTEAGNGAGRQLGEAGLLAIAREVDVAATPSVAGALLAGVASYRRGEADDDSTVLVLRHNAANPGRPSLVERARSLARMIGLVPV